MNVFDFEKAVEKAEAARQSNDTIRYIFYHGMSAGYYERMSVNEYRNTDPAIITLFKSHKQDLIENVFTNQPA